MAERVLTQADLAQLALLGISADEAERQLALFRDPPPPTRLDRPCTPGDGVRLLADGDHAEALAAHADAAARGRVLKFTPASGAASRMFQALLAARAADGCDRGGLERRAGAGDAAAREVLRFADHLTEFAFVEALAALLARQGRRLAEVLAAGDVATVLDAVLGADGLDYAALPKGLLLFHRYADGARTAFEEHLVETAEIARGQDGTARLHLTVSPEHERGFTRLLADVRAAYERRFAARYAIDFSTQKPATDTLAVEMDDRPFRDAAGRLVLRPGGHGALIENLNDLGGDLVLIKNIDNVQPDHRRAEAILWMRLLLGHLAGIQARLFAHLAALETGGAAAEAAARRFANEVLGVETPAGAAALVAALERPLRVCGVVRNTGEPGGGPFWVREPGGGCTAQIVESAQVDQGDPGQRAVFEAATHFNPVLLACGGRDRHGRPFDLRRFVDPAAVFIAHKSKDGRALKALERPGLWNGAMARWLTLFVEVPTGVFTPVKTVNDLLRPEHQPPA